MSNQVANYKKLNLPAHLQNNAKKSTLGGGRYVKGNRLKMVTGRFIKSVAGVDTPLEERTLQVVIVANQPKVGRQYYDKQFGDAEAHGPVCFSTDGMVPDNDSARKMHTNCKTCPMAQKGSAPQGSGAACGRIQRTVVMTPGDETRYIADFKGMSIFGPSMQQQGKLNLQDYGGVLDENNIGAEAVITNLSFDHRETVTKILFEMHDYLDADAYEHIKTISESDEVKKLLAYSGAKAQPGDANDYNPHAAEAPTALQSAPLPHRTTGPAQTARSSFTAPKQQAIAPPAKPAAQAAPVAPPAPKATKPNFGPAKAPAASPAPAAAAPAPKAGFNFAKKPVHDDIGEDVEVAERQIASKHSGFAKPAMKHTPVAMPRQAVHEPAVHEHVEDATVVEEAYQPEEHHGNHAPMDMDNLDSEMDELMAQVQSQ